MRLYPTTGRGLIQAVKMDLPLFIRLMEFAKESAKDDIQLHDIAERAILVDRGLLTMKHYNQIIKGSSL
jgi:hypothetical protein